MNVDVCPDTITFNSKQLLMNFERRAVSFASVALLTLVNVDV